MPIDITPQTSNGHPDGRAAADPSRVAALDGTAATHPSRVAADDLRDVDFLPHHVRGLQSEVVAVMNDCLQELDRVGDLLRGLETPLSVTMPLPRQSSHSRDADRHDQDATPARPAPSSATGYGESRNVSDFDARLANLKRMLAEKLTNNEEEG